MRTASVKQLALIASLACLLHANSSFAQAPNPPAEASRATVVEGTLGRLASLTTLPLPLWRSHDDVAHPEDSVLDDSAWELTKLPTKWSGGTHVFRCHIEVPEKI